LAHSFTTLVSGLPRSGTSMMMAMLEAGGLAPLIDHIRKPDDDNPKGYYEFERVKKIKEDTAWLPEARGKVVKMISMLLIDLPPGEDYRVIFMRRRMPEILASQKTMMERRGTVRDDGPTDAQMAAYFERHLADVFQKMDARDDVRLLQVDYNGMLEGNAEPQVDQIITLLDGQVDRAAMLGVIDKKLYRQRKSDG